MRKAAAIPKARRSGVYQGLAASKERQLEAQAVSESGLAGPSAPQCLRGHVLERGARQLFSKAP